MVIDNCPMIRTASPSCPSGKRGVAFALLYWGPLLACLLPALQQTAGAQPPLTRLGLGQEEVGPAQALAPDEARKNGVIVHSAPLPPSEKLALVFSKTTDRYGKSRQVLVLLGRNDARGWEAVGNGNPQQLRDHWRKAAERSFVDVRKLDLTPQEHAKIDLAIDFTIARFVRAYTGLQYELETQDRDQSQIIGDERYRQLREMANNGVFNRDSLAVRVANTIAGNKQ